MTLGEKLKEARQQFGWSQEELAFKVTNKKFELGNMYLPYAENLNNV